ncbi:hypothetical protein P8605_07440 [Streptomyces sp. T-3]|nr:hypothetical protein [Streptomyces sp. T-3]
MNDPSSPTTPLESADSSHKVGVVLGECSAADANAVFELLRNHFASDRGEEVPRQADRPLLWTGNFLASHSPPRIAPVVLAGSVTADLQGGPVPVARVRETLAAAFLVEACDVASGDQELDVQLTLRSRGPLTRDPEPEGT